MAAPTMANNLMEFCGKRIGESIGVPPFVRRRGADVVRRRLQGTRYFIETVTIISSRGS